MSTFLSSFSCCWIWFLAGALLGWLLNRWLCRACCKPTSGSHATPNTGSGAHSSSNATPAKLVDAPAAPTPSALTPSPAAAPIASAATVAKPAPAEKAEAPKPAATTTIDLAAAKAAGFALKNANDLTVVEGIGPKINDLFHNAGVKTFAQLAAQTVPQMRKVLDDGGSRFRIANPSTWAQQAALAAANKWTELKKLQDELSGGVKK